MHHWKKSLHDRFKIGDWIIQVSNPGRVFKVIHTHKYGHRVDAIQFGLTDAVRLKTRKFRLATEADVARSVADRVLA